MATTNFTSVSEYIAAQPKAMRVVLELLRSTIRKALPGGEEAISYQMPAYKLNGRGVVYFSGWKDHYSIYPSTKRLEAAFKDDLASYELSGKGTIRFPTSEPVPVKLIAAIAKFRAKEVAEAEKTRTAAKKKR